MESRVPRPHVEEIDPAEFEVELEDEEQEQAPLMSPEDQAEAAADWERWRKKHDR